MNDKLFDMKTLLTLILASMALLATGCESTDSTAKTQPAAKTGATTTTTPAPIQYQMTAAEKRVMELQALDREYSEGAMPTNVYYMRQQQILESY